jgi:hypothetical protein
LRQLTHAVRREAVNGVVDMELAQCCDPMPHTALLAVRSARLAAPQCLRRIARRLTAGVQTPGGVVYDALGSPPGALVAPVIAPAFLAHVLDQGLVGVVRPHGHGYGTLLRYAADALAGVETEDEARRCLRVLPVRRGKLGWRLNPPKTPRVAVGQRLAWQVLGGGGRLPTVDVRGFTHDWGRSRRGKARLQRKPAHKRRRRAWVELNPWRRQDRRARQRPALWPAIAQKRRGHFTYVGVTDHSRALDLLAGKGHHRVCKGRKRRSPRRRCTWESFRRYSNRQPLPRPGRLGARIPVWSRPGGSGWCGTTAGRLL